MKFKSVRNAKSKGSTERHFPQRSILRVGIFNIEPEHCLKDLCSQSHRSCKDGYAIDALSRWQDSPGADQSARWLESDDVIEAGGNASRPCGVGTQRKIDFTRCHDNRRARTGAPTNIVGVQGVWDRPEGRSRAVQTTGKLVEVGFPKQLRTGLKQALHHNGVFGRESIKSGARCGRRLAGDVDVVFHGKGEPSQRSGRLPCAGQFGPDGCWEACDPRPFGKTGPGCLTDRVGAGSRGDAFLARTTASMVWGG